MFKNTSYTDAHIIKENISAGKKKIYQVMEGVPSRTAQATKTFLWVSHIKVPMHDR